ncbi:MAG: hypothetical protein GY847_03870 [Proteobacteria bacterium]|nr:hypothetical protein [Pseudomonadota bacterium]
MLPLYIIEEILKRKQEKESSEEVFIERPEFDEPVKRCPNQLDDKNTQERGVVIIDFTI